VFSKTYPATPILFVDAGDFTGDPTPQGRMQTDALIDGMNAMAYKVSNLSLRDLADGYETFLERQKRARFEFVSANIVWQSTGEPIAPPTTVVKAALRDGARTKEVRIGFIGLTRHDPAFHKEAPGGRSIVTIDPLVAVEKRVPALKQKADLIVALVAMDLDQARLLPKKARDIDLVLGGDSTPGKTAVQTRTDDFPEDTQFGRTRLFYAGDQGKILGEVRLFFDNKKTITSTQRSLIGLTREWPDDPALARIQETVKVAINEYNKTQTQGESPFAPAAPAATPTTGAPAPMSPAPRTSAGPISVAAALAQPLTYTGSDRCAPCHEQAFAIWAKSGHAHAFQTLIDNKQEYNPKCLGCHTIGYNMTHGYISPIATPLLVNVGCESCHGPSSRHPDQFLQGFGRTNTEFCVSCHSSENSPDFKPAEYIPKVRHWDDQHAQR